jgi:hypothetical protein
MQRILYCLLSASWGSRSNYKLYIINSQVANARHIKFQTDVRQKKNQPSINKLVLLYIQYSWCRVYSCYTLLMPCTLYTVCVSCRFVDPDWFQSGSGSELTSIRIWIRISAQSGSEYGSGSAKLLNPDSMHFWIRIHNITFEDKLFQSFKNQN